MSSNLAIHLKDIAKTYAIYNRPIDRLKQFFSPGNKTFSRPFEALKPISLDVKKGTTIGVVGRNGAGKSTLLQLICGTLEPTQGSISVNGRVAALLELGAGFNGDFTGKENVFLNAAILGLEEDEIKDKYEDIVAFSGLSTDHLNQPVKTYSSGMYVRLAFAVAVATDPDIFVVDEALAVGDEAFRRKCFAKIHQMQKKGTTIFFVSHNMRMVLELCDHAIMLEAGEMIAQGSPKNIVSYYEQLMAAPESHQPDMVNAIKAGTFAKASHAAPRETEDDLELETTISYVSQGVELSNVKITDTSKKPADILERNTTYLLHVTATVTDDFKQVMKKGYEGMQFGMMITSESGMQLGGGWTRFKRETEMKPGDVFNVTFAFTPVLMSGIYFIHCGCSCVMEGERTRLHRIEDAAKFKMKPLPEVSSMIDFDVKGDIKKATKPAKTKKKVKA